MTVRTPSTARQAHAASGFTLVELLIALAVIVLLTTITLPSFRSMLKDQRVSQSARVIQSMAESARARAIALGRPVALIFDRVPVDPAADTAFNLISDNTCTRLSIGEVFPPYEGDWAGSTGMLEDLRPATPDGIPDTLTIELAKVASLWDTTTGTATGLVEAGDLLQLSDHSQTFSVTAISVTGTSPNFFVQIGFSNPPAGFGTAEPLWSTSGSDVRFRLIRRPSKTLAGSIAIPRGLCVDLSESGIGRAGAEFAVGPRPTTSFADRYGPLFVVFNARGNVDGVYFRQHGTAASATEILFVSTGPTGVMHFLVGRTDQVQPAGAAPVSDRDDFKSNLYDGANIWISINPFTGAIYSSPNAAIDPAATLIPDRQEARAFAISALNGRGS